MFLRGCLLMKRNKLNLTAGILLVITAALSILLEIVYIVNFIRLIELYRSVGYTNFTILILFYAYLFALYLAQAIIYMIFGVKLIKKSNLPNSFAESKTIIIVSLVLTSCSFAFDVQRILTMLYVACIVLLICSLCNGARIDKDNLEYLSREAGLDTNTQVKSQPVQETVAQEIIPEKSDNEMMAEKIGAIKKLKDDGVISQAEFDKVISSFVHKEESNSSKSARIKTSSDNTTPTKRTRKSSKVETTSTSKEETNNIQKVGTKRKRQENKE